MVGISGSGDVARDAYAVDVARRRVEQLAPDDRSAGAQHIRQELADVEEWERRRCGRAVRLWAVHLTVPAAARDVDEAGHRLAGALRQPCHRIGNTPLLYSVAGPVACRLTESEERSRLVADHPLQKARRAGRMPPRNVVLADVLSYAAALTMASRAVTGAAQRRFSDRPAVACAPGEFTVWRVWHRVLFLAGPADASARAGELASTIVDRYGRSAAAILSVTPDADEPDTGSDGPAHPACRLGPLAADALWDDFDAAEHDAEDPRARAESLARAAAELRARFGLVSPDSTPPRASEACPAAVRHVAGQAHQRGANTRSEDW